MAKGEDITTRFRVDISDLKKGITEANNQIKKANAEFNNATAGMDNWAKSSDGIKAKLSQLTSVLQSQTDKLNNYKKQLETAQKAERDAGDEVTKLKSKLEEAKSTFGENSTEVKNLQKQLTSAEKAEQQMKTQVTNLTVTMNNQEATVKKTQREMTSLEGTLIEVEDAEKRAAKSGKSVEEELRDMDRATEQANDGFTVLKGALANLVADGFRKAIDAAKDFAKDMITTAAEVKAEASMFEQTFGDMGDEASAAIKRVADSSGILETRLNNAGAKLYAFARSNGGEATDSLELMEEALQASADSAAYYDRSLDETTETMMSFLKGNFANDAALGISATEFTRNAKATELFGKKYNELNEFEKQKTLLKMVTDAYKVSGAFGQASRESDGWENVMGNLKETWRQFQARVGTPFLEALIPVIQNLTKSFTKWKDSIDWEDYGRTVKKVVGKVIDVLKILFDIVSTGLKILITIAPLLKIIGAGVLAYVTYTKAATVATIAQTAAQKALNVAMNANPIGLVIAGLTALVSLVNLLNDKMNEPFEKLQKELDKATEKIDENVQARQSMVDEMNKENQAGLSNLDYYQQLANELDTIVDANGKVKEGYEGRASFITNQLANGLGLEIEMTDGIISKYDDLKKSIAGVIEQKKAQLVLESQEDLFKAALDNKKQATLDLADAEKDLATKKAIVKKLEDEYGDSIYMVNSAVRDQINQYKEQEKQAQENYDKQKALVEGYYTDIKTYETMYADFKEGNYEKLSTFDYEYQSSLDENSKANAERLQSDIDKEQKHIDELKALKKQGNTDIYDNDIATAEQTLTALKQRYQDEFTVTKEGGENVKKETVSNINEQLATLKGKKYEFKKASDGNMQLYVDGVKEGTPISEAAASKLTTDTLQKIKDKKSDAKSAGEYLIDGVNEGVKNNNKQSSVFSSIASFGSKLLGSLKSALKEHSPSTATIEMGQYLLEGLLIGFEDEENGVLNQVSEFGKNIIETLKDELSENVGVQDMIDNIQTSISKTKNSLSGINVPTLNNGVSYGVSKNTNVNNNTNNFTQIINAPKQPSRIELYRQTKNLLNFKGGY